MVSEDTPAAEAEAPTKPLFSKIGYDNDIWYDLYKQKFRIISTNIFLMILWWKELLSTNTWAFGWHQLWVGVAIYTTSAWEQILNFQYWEISDIYQDQF